MADSVGGDMIRGHIDSIILYSLLDGDKDTNQIRTEIENKAGGDFKLKQGTFYSALQRITKQGLVTDYRTTGADGVRRKFFQLTEKGKAHIEKGQTNWSQSQSVINKLLDTTTGDSGEKSAPSTSIDYKIPSFDTEDDNVIEDFATLSSKDDNNEISAADSIIYSELEDIEQPSDSETAGAEDSDVMELLGVLNAEENKTEEPEPEVTTYTYFETTPEVKPEEKVAIVERIEPEKVEIIPDKTDDFHDLHDHLEYESIYNSDISTDSFANAKENVETPFDNELDDDVSDVIETITTTECDEVEPDSVREEPKVEEKVVSERAAVSKPTEPTTESTGIFKQLTLDDIPESTNSDKSDAEGSDGVDDYLFADDIPDQREYKDVLSKIFQITKENNEKRREEPKSETESRIIDFPPKTETEIPEPELTCDEPENSVIVDELDLNAHESERKNEPDRKKEKKTGTFDYSDIIALSEAEGLKISTSDRTNKSELGRILVNKLNFHSSLLFFILIAIETLIVGLTMESVLNFGTMPYVIFGLIVFILPLISGIIFFISPKRAIAEIRTFKSAFETALIITLDAMIGIIVLAVAFNLDFTSYPDLARIVLVPIIIAVNVPIYVIIRYSLLDKQTYYS